MLNKLIKKIKSKLIDKELKSIYHSYKNDYIDDEYIYYAVNFISKLLANTEKQHDRNLKESLITMYLYMLRKVGEKEKVEKIFKIEFEKGKDGSFSKLLDGSEPTKFN